jgi:hypothetical protein
MRVNTKVPKRQEPVLTYMRSLQRVSNTVDDLVEAITVLGYGIPLHRLPKSVRVNKAFDGGHTETEGDTVVKMIKAHKTLHLRVQRGYIDMSQETYKQRLQRHLEKSDRFTVSFVSPKRIPAGKDYSARNPGITFTILRDGTLLSGVSSSMGIDTNW